MCVEIVRLPGRAAPREIVRARDQCHAAVPQFLCAQQGVTQRTDADRNVRSLLHQIDDAVGQRQFDFHGRMAFGKAGKSRDQALDAEGRRRIDAQQPARDLVRLIQTALDLRHVRDEGAHTIAIGQALCRQGQGTRRSPQKRDGQPFFQSGDGSAYRRRSEAHHAGRLCKAALRCDGQEYLDVAKPIIHDFNSLLK